METDRDIKKDMKESNLFDFSNFPKNIQKTDKDYYYSEDNKFVPGMFLIHYYTSLFFIHSLFYIIIFIHSLR